MTVGAGSSTFRGGSGGTNETPAQTGAAVRHAASWRARRLVRWGFIAFVATVPFDMFPLFGETFALTKLTGLLFLLLALVQPKLTLRRPPAAFWWFCAYLLVAVAAAVPILETGYAAGAVGRLTTTAQMIVMFWIVSNVMRDEELAWKGLVAFYVACVLIAVLMAVGIGRTVIMTPRGERLSFGGGNANAVGSALTLGLFIILAGSLASRFTDRKWKVLLPITGTVLLYGMVVTGSRGAVLGSAAGLLALGLHGERLRSRLRNLLIVLVAGSLVGYGVYTVFISRARLEEAVFGKRLSGREQIYPQAMKMFAERPILGWGPEGNTRELARRVPFMREDSLDTHNLFLYVLTECGIVGFLPFVAGFILCVGSARRAVRSRHGLLPVVLVFAVLAMGLASNWIRRKPLWLVLGYAVAAGASAGPRRRRARVPSEFARLVSAPEKRLEAGAGARVSDAESRLSERAFGSG